ncbi:hypothetical protein GE21DRAFT_1067697 [Neurospora crassa]|nr:hypothetical protein GE21DRAFT_1067697 [Neurospora crassa]
MMVELLPDVYAERRCRQGRASMVDGDIAESLRNARLEVGDVERVERGSRDMGPSPVARLLRLLAWSEHGHHRG